MQIRQWGMPMNANEEMFAGYADPDASYPDADPDASSLTKCPIRSLPSTPWRI